MPKKHGIQVCILLCTYKQMSDVQFITQVVFFLNRCDLFLVILVSHTSWIIAKENLNFEMIYKKGVIKKFCENHITNQDLCWRLFFNKVSGLFQVSNTGIY